MACQLVVHGHFVAIYDASDSQKPAKTSWVIPWAFVRVWWAVVVVRGYLSLPKLPVLTELNPHSLAIAFRKFQELRSALANRIVTEFP